MGMHVELNTKKQRILQTLADFATVILSKSAIFNSSNYFTTKFIFKFSFFKIQLA